MKITLVAVESDLVQAWKRFCGDLEGVEIHSGDIFDVKCDAVVSPANSFGFMDGGIDMAYSQRYGWRVQDRVQALIREHHHGELLVGAADIVETDDFRQPFLISAPTMRVPTVLTNTVNPYLAVRVVLLLIKHGVFRLGALKGDPVSSVVKSVAIPGLGTGVGRVGPNTSARLVRAAIEEVVFEKADFPRTWSDAQSRHQLLYRDRVVDLQFGE